MGIRKKKEKDKHGINKTSEKILNGKLVERK